MSADSERLPPPNEPVAFESLCLDLWKDIWGDPGAQKNGRSGQPQAGVDVFGQHQGQWVGVQCKQKDGLLHRKLTTADLEDEVREALSFRPKLSAFILATSGPRDAKVQERARQLTEEHNHRGLFKVEVWSWEDIWHELYQRETLLKRIKPVYWPRLTTPDAPVEIAPTRLRHGADHLFGREQNLSELDQAWHDPAKHVLTIVAWGGVGKTSLVVEWMARKAAANWPGVERVFDWSFYSQGTREQGAVSADTFVATALEFFGDPEMAKSAASPWDKGARLAQLVAQRRTLLVLDGMEPLQYPPGPMAGKLKDPAIEALLKGLARQNPGLCLVTTRERVTDLAPFRDTTAPEWELEHLSEEAGAALLKSLLEPDKPKGIHRVPSTEHERREISREVKGHALTLRLLGTYIHKALRDVRRWHEANFTKADSQVQGGHAFKTVAAYERWLATGGEDGARQLAVLRLLGLFDRPAEADCLTALRHAPAISGLTEPLVGLAEDDWNLTLSNLADCGLVSTQRPSDLHPSSLIPHPSVDAHPLIREYFAKQLCEQNPEAWRAAHRRLYEYLRDSTLDKSQPALDDLQPLYQAVAHGCKAGMQQEACYNVYRDRIRRGREDYASRRLGAFGAEISAVACFFEQPWSRVSPALTEPAQAWLLAVAAYDLRALGRLTEALEPMRAGMQMEASKEHWKNAAAGASNLSELELTLGGVAGAVGDAEQSVAYADRSGDAFMREVTRTALADALHQAGRRADAQARFREVEEMQAKDQSDYPLLYSLRGFQYCDLLLAAPERSAWQQVQKSEVRSQKSELVKVCCEVEQRASQTLQWVTGKLGLLDEALDHLTLGRAALYAAILEHGSLTTSHQSLDQAVNGLRRAGQQDDLPRGLLTRAWCSSAEATAHKLRGEHSQAVECEARAKADLDEAWEIAERGPMRLFMADIHLHRARLFGRQKEEGRMQKYPWASPQADLAEAHKLIEQCGYWRRKEELEDAEEAAKNW